MSFSGYLGLDLAIDILATLILCLQSIRQQLIAQREAHISGVAEDISRHHPVLPESEDSHDSEYNSVSTPSTYRRQRATRAEEELHLASGTSEDGSPVPTPSETLIESRSPSPPFIPSTPLSPSRWRETRIPNQQLRVTFHETGVCQHYFHEVSRQRLPRCPVCNQPATNPIRNE
jgi:hypothetical protein